MAIALIASVSAAPGPNGGTTAPINTTSANLLVVSVSWFAGGTAPSVSDSQGNTYSGLTAHGSLNARHRVFYCLAPTVGAAHTVTVSGTGSYPAVDADAFSGVASYQVESGAGAGASTSLASGSVTPSADGALILTGLVGHATSATVAPAGFTVAHRANVDNVNMQAGFAYQIQATATAINPTWSYPSVAGVGVSTAVFLPGAPPAAAAARVTQDAVEILSRSVVGARVTQAVVETLIRMPPPGLVITINGVAWTFRHDSMTIRSTLNGRDTLAGILDILDDRDPPTLNQEIVVTEDGVRIFGGVIETLEYRAITDDASQDLMVTLDAKDFNALADNRTVASLTHPGGLTLKQALELLMPELTPFGITLSSVQVDGPVLPSVAFTLQTVTAILDELTKLTEFVWEIDSSKVLTMWQPGSVAAPFDLVDGDRKVWGDIVITPLASDYANRIIVRAGGDAPNENVFAWYTDGVTNHFPMYLHVLQHFGQVLVDTPLETVPGEGFESVGPPGSGALWEFHDGPRYTQYLSRAAGPPPAGNPVGVVPFPLQFKVIQEQPVIVTADDLAGQAANGIIEKLVDQGPNVSSWWELQAIADSLLARHASQKHVVRYATREKGLRVGQSQTITIARRHLSGPHFITDVETQMVGATLLKHTVTASKVELYQGSWRDVYKLWAASSAGSGGGSVAVGTTVPIGGTPVPHHAQHEPGGMDPLTVDSTPSIGSLRTLGPGANQAAPGNDARFTTLALHHATHEPGGTDVLRLTATARLLGRATAGAGAVEELTIGDNLFLSGTTISATSRNSAFVAYSFSALQVAPPGTNQIRFNAGYPYTAVTTVWTDLVTADGQDVYRGLLIVPTGSTLLVQDKNDHTQYAIFTTTGAPVDHTTYVAFPVVHQAHGTSIGGGQLVLFQNTGTAAGGAGLNQLTGDVTAGPGSGSQVATIAAGAVTYAKLQDVSAASRLLGRGSASGSGDAQEIVLGTNLSMSGTTLSATGGGGGSTSAWLAPFTAPVLAAFAWVNQGGATVAATVGGVVITAPASIGENVRLLKHAAPATPYTLTAACLLQGVSVTYVSLGVMFRESATGKLMGHCMAADSAPGGMLAARGYRWGTPTSFNGSPYALSLFAVPAVGGVVWLRLTADGTNLVYSVSADGETWRQLFTEVKTAFFTTAPDEIGFFASSGQGTHVASLTLLSWTVT